MLFHGSWLAAAIWNEFHPRKPHPDFDLGLLMLDHGSFYLTSRGQSRVIDPYVRFYMLTLFLPSSLLT